MIHFQQFIKVLALLIATGIGIFSSESTNAQQPVRSAETSNVKIALAAYSFRDHFEFIKGKPQTPKGKKITMFEFIDYCAKHKCGAELTSYFFRLMQMKPISSRSNATLFCKAFQLLVQRSVITLHLKKGRDLKSRLSKPMPGSTKLQSWAHRTFVFLLEQESNWSRRQRK